MGYLSTKRIITEPLTIENHGNAGQFGLVSCDPSQPIYITIVGADLQERRIEIVDVGDGIAFSALNIDQIVVEADSYPTTALIKFTTGAIELDKAPFTTVVGNLSTFSAHFDGTVAGAATTTIWTPGAGRRFVLSDWSISTDVANRVALVDGSDVAGQRIAAPYLAANGGQAGGGYVSGALGRALKLVSLAGGHVFVSVNGYETS